MTTEQTKRAQHTPGPMHLPHLNRKWLSILLEGACFYRKVTMDDPLKVVRSTVRELHEQGLISSRDIHDAFVCQNDEDRAAITKATGTAS